jgi:hypothetical protein
MPPVSIEEKTKKGDVEDVKIEDTKRDKVKDEDAMDVEQTSVQPLLKETANEHLSDQPTHTSMDRKEVEDVAHAH